MASLRILGNTGWTPLDEAVAATVEVTIPVGLTASEVLDSYAEAFPNAGRLNLVLIRSDDLYEVPGPMPVPQGWSYYVGTKSAAPGVNLSRLESSLSRKASQV